MTYPATTWQIALDLGWVCSVEIGIMKVRQCLWPGLSSIMWLWMVPHVKWGLWSKRNSKVPTTPLLSETLSPLHYTRCLAQFLLFAWQAGGKVKQSLWTGGKRSDALVCVSRVVTLPFGCYKTPLRQIAFTSLRPLAAFWFGVWNLRICLITFVDSIVVWSGRGGFYEFQQP